MRQRLLIACLALCPALVGCFDVEQTLTLDRDLSGKAAFSMKVNMEPMVLFMLRMQREMEGKTGEPTAEEIAKAKQDFLTKKTTQSTGSPEQQLAEVEEKLPPGIKLLDSSVIDEGPRLGARFSLAFDDISKLAALDIGKEGEQQAGPENPFDHPFANLKLTDEGKTLLLTTEAINPAAEQKEQAAQMDLSPEAKQQVEEAFRDLRVAFRIEAPFEVVETNAMRREGRMLIWEYDLAAMEKMTPEQLAQGVMVRYRK